MQMPSNEPTSAELLANIAKQRAQLVKVQKAEKAKKEAGERAAKQKAAASTGTSPPINGRALSGVRKHWRPVMNQCFLH